MTKRILLTGASKGIGLETAKLLAQAGHKLSLAARNIEPLHALKEQYGDQILLVPTDVTKADQVQALADRTVEVFGGIDVLVNNAGMASFDFLKDGKAEDWERMVDVNIKGVLFTLHAVLPVMEKQEDGHIVNLGSVAAHHVFPRSVVYCATKHAVLALSEGLRLELQNKIRTTTISPGAVATEFAAQTTNPELREEMASYLKDGLDPVQVAKLIQQCIELPPEMNMTEMIVRPVKRG
ncbi:SDR family oxidoreductase [Pontibacter sp. G13]|uniref:SDR family oxidoreductase n=1 Tax=Pontibacter sp. G13 TaxID=3074898 RepID=UPI00288A1417|nr:SDR family oxidoreductase [Pontibacter sp. G13]WNJ19214.1 SDR family oxidoreductase [Pontibacter sp. G13]